MSGARPDKVLAGKAAALPAEGLPGIRLIAGAKAILCACTATLALQAGAEPLPAELFARLETLSYRYSLDTRADSPFQRIAAQPDHSWDTELRPDLSWTTDTLGVTLRPRALLNKPPAEAHVGTWLNEGWLRWRPVEGLSLQGGREALLWGPSMFWNPSNPFFIENNKNNPKREITGKDFLRTRWQLGPRTALNAISQLGGGHRSRGAQRMDGFKLDWTGADASASAIVAAAPAKTPSWQGWAQWTAGEALLLYGELSWRRAWRYALPVQAANPTDRGIDSTSAHHALLAVAGASYTFENDWTLHTEYWHNGAGLRNADAASMGTAVAALGLLPHGRADQRLGALLAQPAPLRRNYLGLQLGGSESASLGWRLRVTHNLDDQSDECVLMLDRDLGDSTKLWFNLMRRFGSANSEYGRWVRGSAMLGVTLYGW